MGKNDSRNLLKVFDSLPSLLDLAREESDKSGRYIYDVQDELREEHRRRGIAFRWSMLYRSLYSCPKCKYTDTVVGHELENPQMDVSSPLHRVRLRESDVHEVRAHKGLFPEDCRAFLENLIQSDC
jgi:hypothetical protein